MTLVSSAAAGPPSWTRYRRTLHVRPAADRSNGNRGNDTSTEPMETVATIHRPVQWKPWQRYIDRSNGNLGNTTSQGIHSRHTHTHHRGVCWCIHLKLTQTPPLHQQHTFHWSRNKCPLCCEGRSHLGVYLMLFIGYILKQSPWTVSRQCSMHRI